MLRTTYNDLSSIPLGFSFPFGSLVSFPLLEVVVEVAGVVPFVEVFTTCVVVLGVAVLVLLGVTSEATSVYKIV